MLSASSTVFVASSPLRGRPPLQHHCRIRRLAGPLGFIAPPGATSIAAPPRSATPPAQWWLHRPSGGDLHCSLMGHREALEALESFIAPPGATSIAASGTSARAAPLLASSSPLRGRPPLQRLARRPGPPHCSRLHRPSGGDLHCSVADTWKTKVLGLGLHRPSGGDLHCS